MKPFEEVLAAGGQLVASWDYHDGDRTRLCLFTIGSRNASMAASTTVPRDLQEAMAERLLSLGVRLGGSFGSSLFVWTADEGEFSIWSDETMWKVPRSKPVVGVTVFYGADPGHRGVRVTLADGGLEIVAEEHDPSARIDPVYDADDLENDTRWARALAEHLAGWFLCPLEDEITHTTIEADLAIARMLRGLADEVAGSAEIVKPFG